ncbi:MAG: septum formation initiator family protein [Ruminococcaceae bacterium]|nr:septum formation initiator family protein [Oscillospiraceae bacterium]
MGFEKYFVGKKSVAVSVVRIFIALLLVFSLVFFLWSLMKYNKIMDEKRENEAYIQQLQDSIDELQYLVDMPLDDAYKIRIARERLGMCFPDEIIYYTDME